MPNNDEDHGPLAHLPDYSYLSKFDSSFQPKTKRIRRGSFLDGEPSRLSGQQKKNYEFNASIVRRVHELDHELTQAKKMYAEKIASTMSEYERTVAVAEQIRSRPSKTNENVTSKVSAKPSIRNLNEFSSQPHLLNALRDAKTYNEAFEEVVDPVGSIVPNKLMKIDRPNYKHTGDRRRQQKIFRLRTPTLRMFPR